MAKERCPDPAPILDDFAEALALAAAWDAAAARAAPASDEPSSGRLCHSSIC
jgi:hypothetical protein